MTRLGFAAQIIFSGQLLAQAFRVVDHDFEIGAAVNFSWVVLDKVTLHVAFPEAPVGAEETGEGLVTRVQPHVTFHLSSVFAHVVAEFAT